ncbi:ATP12 chaperone protein [Tritonibacter multivorans]|uniref:ATP12 chaperone protein n=1 Tax=Tritonibacter multivorans TaxID=928856 RepID=A0A0N7LZF2_9RHOB|nr:ATP12 family protein [Tritonibacter multivorans]MDA7421212.1 ATPase [Tritonibacter multivorans]CUH77497.1 ATP12 chaperone protein [Tritonibacter multivorans]SFD32986.1 Chaperone required for the assembly of the F1-ATPase [Tritonibacter multivorans]
MSEWKQKRFWKEVSVVEEARGFAVALDGRKVKTPAKSALVVPTRKMAEAIAAEWDAQDEGVDPLTMPFTRSANASIDKVTVQFAEVADMLAEYGDSDLLCYRADGPEGLVARQAEVWDPLLDWGAEALGARLEPRTGILHEGQDAAALAALRKRVHGFTAFELAAFHDLVGISGSLILGFAAALDHLEVDALWEASRLDERWQEEQWGIDEEARSMEGEKKKSFAHAVAFFRSCSE